MRDEDLKNLPQSISREKMFEALALTGFGPEQWKDISHIGIGPQPVTITAYWVDEDGKRIKRDFSDTQLAVPEFTVMVLAFAVWPVRASAQTPGIRRSRSEAFPPGGADHLLLRPVQALN